jgi:hypothetical protein
MAVARKETEERVEENVQEEKEARLRRERMRRRRRRRSRGVRGKMLGMRIVCRIRCRKTVIRAARGGGERVWEAARTTPGEKGGQVLEEVLLMGMEE